MERTARLSSRRRFNFSILVVMTAALWIFATMRGYCLELYESTGRFAYTVPPGWELSDHP